MIEIQRFALNRIATPTLAMAEFFKLAADIGLKAVELRNDIRDGSVSDGLSSAEILRLARAAGIKIITINALQQFNLPSARQKALAELEVLLAFCRDTECPALVLCPNNKPEDTRSPEKKYHDTVESLNTYAQLFSAAGILGYIEPLGFGISSLNSAEIALKAIGESGASCYRVLIDTFHSFLGPDTPEFVCSPSTIKNIGLVHISGVEENIDKAQFSDAHRVLCGPKDVMKSAQLVNQIEKAGYKGYYSFEPFSGAVQTMSKKELAEALSTSIRYLAQS